MTRVARWLDSRLGLARAARGAADKAFPDHWSFMLGEIALYSFVVLVATGVWLALVFEPSTAPTVYRGEYEPLRGIEVSRAYASTLEISFDLRAGLLIRQTHHWAALVFVAAIVLHLLRIFFTGAFRRPREVNWLVGVTLLALAIFNGFTGYSLPDDLLSGTGLRIAYAVALSVPLLGEELAFLVFGGEFPSEEMIARLFTIHVLLVPAAIVALISIHLAIVWRQKHTQLPGGGRRERNVVGLRLWPTYALQSLALLFAVAALLAALGGLVQINPVWLYGPFLPSTVTTPAQPDWYLAWVEGALRIFPPVEVELFDRLVANVFFPGVLLPTVTFALLYAWPFLEARATRDRSPHELLDRPRDRPLRTAIGIAAIVFYALLLLAAANDLIALLLGVPVESVTWAFRVLVPLAPPLAALAAYRLFAALRAVEAEGPLSVPARVLAREPGE